MNREELNTALYEKMAAEQNTFRDWLKSQSAQVVLDHAYKYTICEDILITMEDLDLPAEQAEALLKSPSPLSGSGRKELAGAGRPGMGADKGAL